MNVREYWESNSSLGKQINWDSPFLVGDVSLATCDIHSPVGQTTVALADATENLFQKWAKFKPLSLTEILKIAEMVQHRLEIIWAG